MTDDCNCEQAQALQAQLDAWRSWAQFVFGGDGPVVGPDDMLRTWVCAKYDADVALAGETLAHLLRRASALLLDAGEQLAPREAIDGLVQEITVALRERALMGGE
jgi:hypothetical protein